METVIVLGLAMGTVLFLAYPFFGKKVRVSSGIRRSKLQILADKKEQALQVLKELEFDFKTGKLSESDYELLKERYRLKALSFLKRMDELSHPQVMESHPPEKALPRKPEKIAPPLMRPSKRPTCPNCGKRLPGNFKFCPFCGAAVAAG